LFLFVVVAMWGVSDRRGVDCFVSCSLLLPCGVSAAKCGRGSGKKTNKKRGKNPKNPKKPTKKQVPPSEKPMLIKGGADKRRKKQRKRRKKGWQRGRVGMRRGTE
jgi:hypothetical protein